MCPDIAKLWRVWLTRKGILRRAASPLGQSDAQNMGALPP